MSAFYPRMTFLVRRRRNEHGLPAQMLMETQPTWGPLPTAAKCNRVNRTRPSPADKGKILAALAQTSVPGGQELSLVHE